MLRSIYRSVRTSLMTGRLAWLGAVFDLLRPAVRGFLWEPLNGQSGRRELVEELVRLTGSVNIVETGTFRGSSTKFLAGLGVANVVSAEAVARYYWYARFRVGGEPRIRLIHGDSRSMLRVLSSDESFTSQPTLFYLDAHWHDDLPLAGELREISRSWHSWVAVIDDFRVPDDPLYGFDDYGPGKSLDLEYLTGIGLTNLSVFWPRLRASEESGLRRGCAVVTTDDATAKVLRERATCLRQTADEGTEMPTSLSRAGHRTLNENHVVQDGRA